MKLGLVLEAVEQIWRGAQVRSLETDMLDFKQDPATIPAPNTPANPQSRLVEVLVEAAVCFANSEGGGCIVLGVTDRGSGAEALVGTNADADFLRRKIFDKTRPNLQVTVQEHVRGHARLLLIDVPEGLDLYTDSRGRAVRRRGSHCEVMSEVTRQELSFRRRDPDYTARVGTRSASDLDPRAVAEARRLLRGLADLRSELAGQPDEQLLRSLGLVDREGRLLVAGEVLLARPAAASIAYLARATAGGEPSAVHLREPLILALPEVLGRIRERARPELSRIVTPTGQEIAIPDFPPVAVDEAVTNALVHRDWSQTAAVVVDHNPLSLRVWSPGGLPAGVDREHLLTTTSRPRNTTLMNAIRTLGLAEATSRGFDRMYREMIRTGRDAPVVVPDDFSVEIIFTSGAPNRTFATYVAGLPERLRDDVNVLLTLMKLCEGPRIGADQAATLLQVQHQEAERVLEWMATAEVGLLIPDRGKASSARWRLAPATHAGLGTAVAHRARGDFALTQVTAHLEEYGWITNRTIRNMFSLDVQQARALLAGLRDQGLIIKDPDGPDRGPGIRWLPGPAGPRSRNRTGLRREPDR